MSLAKLIETELPLSEYELQLNFRKFYVKKPSTQTELRFERLGNPSRHFRVVSSYNDNLERIVNYYNTNPQRKSKRANRELDTDNYYQTLQQATTEGFYLERFNKNVATQEMYDELIKEYALNAQTSLKKIAKNLSKKYNINISSSTISKYARKALNCKKRKLARDLYPNFMAQKTKNLYTLI
jgi:hypothetical protein